MPKKRTNLNLNEVSLVDAPANKGSRVALFKRDTQPTQTERLIKVCKGLFDNPQADFRQALSNEMQEERFHEIMDDIMPLVDALQESVMVSAANMEGEDREAKIRENVEQFLASVRDELGGSGSGESTPGMGNESGGGSDNPPIKSAGSSGSTNQPSNQEGTMSDETEKRLGDLEKQVEQFTTQAEAHGLTVTKADDGSVTLTKAEDETVTDPDGNIVRKSEVGESQFSLIKSMANRLSDVEKQRQREQLAKRAEDELPNVGGEPMQKADVLAAVEACDESTREALKGHLSTLNKLMGEQFKDKGHNAGNSGTESLTKLDTLAKERAEKTGETKEAAYAEVLKTDQGAELYNQHLAERAN